MIERIKTVSNPLTIIAIFAALAEIAGTIALATVDKELQRVFVWFVMMFPTLIVILFFLTLNFNPKVLYAPSDFRDEENFLNTLNGRNELSLSFDVLSEQLEIAKEKIVQEATKQVGAAGAAEATKFRALVSKQIELIRDKVESTRESAEELTAPSPLDRMPHSALQARILAYVASQPNAVSVEEVARSVGMSIEATARSLSKLAKRELVKQTNHDPANYAAIQKIGL